MDQGGVARRRVRLVLPHQRFLDRGGRPGEERFPDAPAARAAHTRRARSWLE